MMSREAERLVFRKMILNRNNNVRLIEIYARHFSAYRFGIRKKEWNKRHDT